MVKKTFVLGGIKYYVQKIRKEREEKAKRKKPEKKIRKPRYGRANGIFICKEYTPKRRRLLKIARHKISIVGKFFNYEDIAVSLMNKHQQEFAETHDVVCFYLTYVSRAIRKRNWIKTKKQPTTVRIFNRQSLSSISEEEMRLVMEKLPPELKKLVLDDLL